MVTVVDAFNFIRDYGSGQSLKDRQMETHQEDARTIVDLLIDQIEFSNVVILNKVDLINEKERQTLRGIIVHLNPNAKLIETRFSQVDVTEILNTGLFDFEKVEQGPGWLKELRGEHIPETIEYGISSFVFRARRPFHAERLHSLVMKSERYGADSFLRPTDPC